MDLRYISSNNIFSNLASEKRPWQKDYLAMYSSQWQGFVTDPSLMMIPIDDHLAHRGDGVFDVIRCVKGKIFQIEAHLKRLERSAQAISLDLPSDYRQVREIIKTLVLKGEKKDCIIRVTLSRGPGSFSTNPFDCPRSQLYINIVRFKRLPEKYYKKGIPIIKSAIPIKKSFFATIKSCNYLPNVLMKMEAVNAGCHYSIALDEEGFLAEGSTENIGILSKDGVLKFPGFEKTLAGTTVKRIFELGHTLLKEGLVKEIRFDRISLEEVYLSSEIMLMGTSINILPVISFDGRTIGSGSPGPVYAKLSELLWKDMTENMELLLELGWETN